jgi:hypothetical protein
MGPSRGLVRSGLPEGDAYVRGRLVPSENGMKLASYKVQGYRPIRKFEVARHAHR